MDYREAGVDISAADAAKARIKALARGTFNPGVLSEIGSFGGMFRPDLSAYREPVLVASTDGVGTKIQVARAMDVHDTVGYDLDVGESVNCPECSIELKVVATEPTRVTLADAES